MVNSNAGNPKISRFNAYIRSTAPHARSLG
ncbi:hypothetical protein HCH_04205 [Hahella chejuensis KCTC 2396]|uniref:Uncharacterized protein n=1 Tax=Hahella chejuensis (strain KCTC 2396) TaxID=349521 RepID=Q2SEL2_HAHCH|nr:hypothetical protein HCH_04205 [Hahella chejuensis KCTC 2396]